jgi:hypothetical protein
MLFLRGEKKNRKENEIKKGHWVYRKSRRGDLYKSRFAQRAYDIYDGLDLHIHHAAIDYYYSIRAPACIYLSLSPSFSTLMLTSSSPKPAKTERRYFIYCLMYSSSYLIFCRNHTHTHTRTPKIYKKDIPAAHFFLIIVAINLFVNDWANI